ncbi:hypothetical protein QL093DRAFT_2360718 [Fusarium oxysporum]|nr:hypothetical protein QL093DRAFT_2360718 [Fusarium oxysporum]
MVLTAFLSQTATIIMLWRLPVALAHGGGGCENDEIHGIDKPKDNPEYSLNYFVHPDYVDVIYSHIAFMVIAWVFVLPVAVMLSLARSGYAIALHLAFMVTNALGLLLGIIYNAQTPDLYPNNAHHKVGWIVTWVVSAQVLVSAVGWSTGRFQGTVSRTHGNCQGFIPVSTEAMDEYQCCTRGDHNSHERLSCSHRLWDDSGQVTDPNTESLRSNTVLTNDGVDDAPICNRHQEAEDGDDDADLEAMALSPNSGKSIIAIQTANIDTSRIWRYLYIGYHVVDRIILPFGFIALATGIATFSRFFEGNAIFGGLAHWIKGGTFFWLGLFTLGRWSGSFGELGWAWNVRPKRSLQTWCPSAEFVESALIFFYGSTNIFLEHLSGWGGRWTTQDMEHISITVLFIGGGLVRFCLA